MFTDWKAWLKGQWRECRVESKAIIHDSLEWLITNNVMCCNNVTILADNVKLLRSNYLTTTPCSKSSTGMGECCKLSRFGWLRGKWMLVLPPVPVFCCLVCCTSPNNNVLLTSLIVHGSDHTLHAHCFDWQSYATLGSDWLKLYFVQTMHNVQIFIEVARGSFQ